MSKVPNASSLSRWQPPEFCSLDCRNWRSHTVEFLVVYVKAVRRGYRTSKLKVTNVTQ
ncbi:MAG TPA: hypothetical protein VGC70_01485 [Burkholderiales bacterium]